MFVQDLPWCPLYEVIFVGACASTTDTHQPLVAMSDEVNRHVHVDMLEFETLLS